MVFSPESQNGSQYSLDIDLAIPNLRMSRSTVVNLLCVNKLVYNENIDIIFRTTTLPLTGHHSVSFLRATPSSHEFSLPSSQLLPWE